MAQQLKQVLCQCEGSSLDAQNPCEWLAIMTVPAIPALEGRDGRDPLSKLAGKISHVSELRLCSRTLLQPEIEEKFRVILDLNLVPLLALT